MLLKLKISLLLLIFALFSGRIEAQKDSLVVKKKSSIKGNNFMPYTQKVMQLKVDSTYFTKINFTAKRKYPVFKRSDVAKVTVFSHASENELKEVSPKNASDKLFLITDSLAIVNIQRRPLNKADLSPAAIDSVLAIFNNKKLFQKMIGGGSSCFFPRHTILFYDKNNLVIGYIEICFQCDMVLSSPNLKKMVEGNFKEQGEERMKSIFLWNKIRCW